MAHEEPAGEVVGMMAGLGNPAVIGCQQVTDLGHYAHAVGAGNYQTKGSHQVSLQSPVLRRAPGQGQRRNRWRIESRVFYSPPRKISATGGPVRRPPDTNGIAVRETVFLYN